MDVKASLEEYQTVTNSRSNSYNIKTSIDLIKQSDIDHEFRTTVIPGIHDTDMLQEIKTLIEGAKRFTLQGFQPTNCMNPSFNNLSRLYEKDASSKKTVGRFGLR
tara:strand:+ start:1264 stop:1578 length:315 start_codon:yes stop_codon:yes gene_type:complete